MEPTTPNTLRIKHPHEDRERKFEVICKVRPLQPFEPRQDITIGESSPTVTIYHPQKNLSKEFTFHRVYGEDTPQGQFSETLSKEVIANCRQNGKGCLVLSYGVTNSGKTFTIFGNDEHPGLLPVLVASLPQGQARIRAVQIYNDSIYCLRTGKELQWSESRCIQQCQYQPIDNKNSKEVLSQFMKMRRTDETESNLTSSRSHGIFMVEWEGYHVAITDLAGNERFGAYNNFNETVKINSNLLVLGQCLTAFRDGEYIPYRRSKLTQVLMEYFKPSYKIFMVAHLNRSGLMFHENFNVMEYASLSTEIHHLQPNMAKNPSIAKSVRKDRSPSPVPFQKKVQIPVLPSVKKEHEEDYQRKQNRMLLQNYKCYIMGLNAQAEADLEEYFKKEDQKDRLFLEELKASKFISPTKDRKLWLEKMEAESRMKLRQIFLEEAQAEKKQKRVQFGTVMGASMIKNYTQSQQTQSQQVQASQQERKLVDFGTSIGVSFKKQQQLLPTSQGLLTPLKAISPVESASYFKRVVNNPSLILQSGYRMITNLHTVAGQMMDAFKGLVIEQRPKKFDNPEAERQAQEITNRIVNIKTEVVGNPNVEIPRLVVVKERHSSQKKQKDIEFKDQTGPKMEEKAVEIPIEEKKEEDSNQNYDNKEEEPVRYPSLHIPQQQNAQQRTKPEQMIIDIPQQPFSSQQSPIFGPPEDLNISFIQNSNQNPSSSNKDNENNMILAQLRESTNPIQNINAVNISIIIQNNNDRPVEDSMLLDGLRSEKDRSTNRSSEIDLLHSDSSHRNQLKPIEPIYQHENETNTKVPVTVTHSNRFFPLQQKKQEKNYKAFLQDGTSSKSTVQLVENKQNQMGVKDTFQTGSEHTKVNKSVSNRKKSNKHHHCNSNAKAKMNQKHYRKENVTSKSRMEVVVRSVSGIKTRNMRRNNSKQ